MAVNLSTGTVLSTAGSRKHRLRVKNAVQVVLVCSQGQKMLKGPEMQSVEVLEATGGQGLSVVVDRQGKIAAVGQNEEVGISLVNNVLITRSNKLVSGNLIPQPTL